MRLAAGGRVPPVTYVDDVFSAYTYTGTGATLNIVNGIDLAGKGGMVWSKRRDSAQNHGLFDSVTGLSSSLNSASTTAQIATSPDIISFNSNGVTYGAPGTYIYNFNGGTYVNWTFRKAAKFFDVVTWTGNGANRTIPHSLGSVPGMIIVKLTSSTSNWHVYHQSIANTEYLLLNTTAAKATDATLWNSSTATSSVFSLGTNASVNQSGQTYVAYLFAHDPSPEGIIQCGTWTGAAAVNLGWEPQYVLIKAANAVEDWYVNDASRGLTAPGSIDPSLKPNLSAAEATGVKITPNATGFTTANLGNTYIYMAIRRPNKPPTVGTQVYNAIARTGTGAAATVTGVGFAPDLVLPFNRSGVAGGGHPVYDRLRGALKSLRASGTGVENTDTASLTAFGMDGMTLGADGGEHINSSRESSIINHFFKRAVGVFDQVCYKGTGVAKTEAHNLGVVPELMIVKSRSGAENWFVYSATTGNTYYLLLNDINFSAGPSATVWNSTTPTQAVFSLGTAGPNTNAATYVAYLFATKAGISKVGSYTGTATTNAIDCGFTTGARFILIKRVDSTGDWYVWDTVRGIIAGNDPYVLLNSTAAETTSTDYIDPSSAGFELSSTAPAAINASGGSFIYLAFA
jgi:hypothetical protein